MPRCGSLRKVHIEDFCCLITDSLIHTHPGEKPCTEGEGVIGRVNRVLCTFFFFGLLHIIKDVVHIHVYATHASKRPGIH